MAVGIVGFGARDELCKSTLTEMIPWLVVGLVASTLAKHTKIEWYIPVRGGLLELSFDDTQ